MVDPWLPGPRPAHGKAEPESQPPPAESSGEPEPAAIKPWRVFIAIEMPEEVRSLAGRLRERLPRDLSQAVRWVGPEAVHLTLRFIGDVDPVQVDAVSAALARSAANSGPFTLHLGGVGAFPSLYQPGVLWIGVGGEVRRLAQLHGRLEGALSVAGFPRDDRRYDPHITIGRVPRSTDGRRQRQLGHAFSRLSIAPTSVKVDSVVLFRSHLGPSGVRYERLHQARLG